MNLENIKVREVSAPEKGKAEIEQELLDKSALQTENTTESDKAPEVEKKEENNVELTDSSVKDYLEKRYNKSIDSFEDLLKEKEEQPELPEDVSSFLKYKKETGRGINDYVKLNRDFEDMQPDNLLAEYFLATDEAIDSEDVDALLDDYRFDEDVDDAQVIKKRKLAKKRAVVKARKYFNEQKEQYKQPLESRTVASSNETVPLHRYDGHPNLSRLCGLYAGRLTGLEDVFSAGAAWIRRRITPIRETCIPVTDLGVDPL